MARVRATALNHVSIPAVDLDESLAENLRATLFLRLHQIAGV